MKVLWTLGWIILICGCCIAVKAQADCFLDFRLYVRDSKGNILKNVSIKLNLNDVEYDNEKDAYILWRRISCYEKNGLLKVKVSGFNEFEKKIEKMAGHQSYDLRLSPQATKTPPIFEKLTVFIGQVFDENKALITGAKLQITEENGKKYFDKTDDNGRFDFDLPLGKFIAKISQNGFKNLKLINLDIENNRRIYLDLTLKIRGCDDCKGSILGEEWEPKIQEIILDYQKIKEKY